MVKSTRMIEELLEAMLSEMELLDLRLEGNPLDARANARWKVLDEAVKELLSNNEL